MANRAPEHRDHRAAVIRRDGRLLHVRMRSSPWWFLPGGHVEPGEPAQDALRRELAEELGIEATVERFAGAVEHGYVREGTAHHEINLVFDVTINDQNPTSHEDHLEAHWLPLDQLAGTDVRPTALRDALTNGDRTPFWRGWAGAQPGGSTSAS